MCSLSAVFTFVLAHIVASTAYGGGWRGAARAPFAVFIPAFALILLHAVWTDSYRDVVAQLFTLLSWELLYFFLFVCVRIAFRSTPDTAPVQALPRR